MNKYEKAVLDLIAYTEGTLGVSQNGYDVAVGFYIILNWTPDTNITHGYKKWYNKETNSTAAGRYQFNYPTWTGSWVGGTENKPGPNKPMTKDNQDKAALYVIYRQLKKTGVDSRPVKLEELTNRDKFFIFLNKIAPKWSSIPLTKDIYRGDRLIKAGRSYYSGDGVNNTRHSANELFNIFKKTLALYE